MEDMSLEKLDYLILKQLFPNLSLTISDLVEKITNVVYKKIEYISRYDVSQKLNLFTNVTRNHLLTVGFDILFDLDYIDNVSLEEDILSIIETDLVKLIVMDGNQFKLTTYGKFIYNTIGLHQERSPINFNLRIRFNKITDLSTLKSRMIIVKNETNLEDQRELIVILDRFNLKQANIKYWELMESDYYIKGIIDEIGIVKKIIFISKTPFHGVITESFLLLSKKNPIFYILKSKLDGSIIECKSSLLEYLIPLNQNYWNFDQGEFTFLRSGLRFELEKVIKTPGEIIGFDRIFNLEGELVYQNEIHLNFFDIDTTFKDKDFLAFFSINNRVIVISWSDIEIGLDLNKKRISLIRRKLKKLGEVDFIISAEGQIFKQTILEKEIFIGTGIQFYTYIYLNEPEIDFVTPIDDY